MATESVKARLEELRVELRAERMSYGELVELQGLAEYIEPSDVELLEAAGVPEHPDEDDAAEIDRMTKVLRDNVAALLDKGCAARYIAGHVASVIAGEDA